ncbi:MAG: class I mannose-6-phosphate isomerase [Verrucomicrobia bacterium]|nr:class I mannose-6-phosphate isomerase [Verrucomicrobiota bacterium]MDA1087036.1 class I mannose-6-phosphate isomerase [Verrucomicrobiota bacterium]
MDPETIYPLLFEPVYKDYIWGGDRIGQRYPDSHASARYAESWEVSDRVDGMSVVRNGPLSGKSLREVLARMGEALVGCRGEASVFPLLVKILDANATLSIQVHPDDGSALQYGGEAKTEAWTILEAPAGARLYAGLTPGTDANALQAAISEGRVEDVVRSHAVEAGDAMFVAGGTVHAVGEGLILLEVQQNSNTTYRIHDWGRSGADGKPRDLHQEQANQVIRWDANPQVTKGAAESPEADMQNLCVLVECPYFCIHSGTVSGPLTRLHDGSTYTILFIAGGNADLSWDDEHLALAAGSTVLIPAALPEWAVQPQDGPLRVIVVTEPT